MEGKQRVTFGNMKAYLIVSLNKYLTKLYEGKHKTHHEGRQRAHHEGRQRVTSGNMNYLIVSLEKYLTKLYEGKQKVATKEDEGSPRVPWKITWLMELGARLL